MRYETKLLIAMQLSAYNYIKPYTLHEKGGRVDITTNGETIGTYFIKSGKLVLNRAVYCAGFNVVKL